MEKAEGTSGGDGDGGGGGGGVGRGDSNEATGDNFRVGGLEARGKSGLMKHRFGRQTASGEGSNRTKVGVYPTDNELGKAKSEKNPSKKASLEEKLPPANQWIIGVDSGGQSNEAEKTEREGGGGGRGAPAHGDSRDHLASVNWGVSLEGFFHVNCWVGGVT